VEKSYKIQEFAALAGVTVRALHHYDRLGLLKPRRTESGYRLYRERDLERLEQVVAFKFLGLPLKQIGAMLDHARDLPAALHMQRTVLEEKRRLMDRAIQAIQNAEKSLDAGGRPDAALLKNIIEVIEMQNDTNWTQKYYSPEAQAKIDARGGEWNPEMQARITQQWTDLFREVEAILDQDPAGEKAQALAVRWKALVSGFTGGDPEISSGLKKLYTDRANWPAQMHEQMAPFSDRRVWEFMGRATQCGAIRPAE
jgi:DNA-binding transcriptional MerR regulator